MSCETLKRVARVQLDQPVNRHAPRPLRILVADDNADGRDMLSFYLTLEGHTVATADDGPAAIQEAESFRPEVAILDIGMPGLTGCDVAKQLRTTEHGAAMMFIALSGLGQADDKERARQAGFDHHFTKPIDVAALTALLARVEALPADDAAPS